MKKISTGLLSIAVALTFSGIVSNVEGGGHSQEVQAATKSYDTVFVPSIQFQFNSYPPTYYKKGSVFYEGLWGTFTGTRMGSVQALGDGKYVGTYTGSLAVN